MPLVVTARITTYCSNCSKQKEKQTLKIKPRLCQSEACFAKNSRNKPCVSCNSLFRKRTQILSNVLIVPHLWLQKSHKIGKCSRTKSRPTIAGIFQPAKTKKNLSHLQEIALKLIKVTCDVLKHTGQLPRLNSKRDN